MKCEICGEEISGAAAFTCNYCGGVFCPKHRLPFNHACKNIAEWKKSGVPGKKKVRLTKKASVSADVPVYLKKEVLIGVVLVITLLILLFAFIL